MAMTKVDLDLGEKPGENMPCCVQSDADHTYYPSFHYSSEYDLMEDFPKKGQMVIEYEVARSTETTDQDGDEHYECDIRVKKIVAVEGGTQSPTSKKDDAGDALDKLAEALQERMEHEGNGNGDSEY